MPPVRIYHNLIRYKNSVPPADLYVVSGTAKSDNGFNPELNGEWEYNVNIVINTNSNNGGN